MVDENVKHSEAKAEVARMKPRDSTGKFLSNEEKAAYQARQAQQAYAAGRAAFNAKIGKVEQPIQQPMQQPQQAPQQPYAPIQQNLPNINPRDNFQSILNANKPGARTPTLQQPIQQNVQPTNFPTNIHSENNFQNILNANKPRSQQVPEDNVDRWDVLLGKKRTNLRW